MIQPTDNYYLSQKEPAKSCHLPCEKLFFSKILMFLNQRNMECPAFATIKQCSAIYGLIK